jgi:methylglutaconyl-CoA hydratase
MALTSLALESQIGILTLNRPEKHNALNNILANEILAHLQEVNNNPEIRVLILQGNGQNFCAGADLHWLMDDNNTAGEVLAELLYTLQQLTKPTIALAQGNIYGGGIGLLSCCDIALSDNTASFCFPEVKLGLIPAIIAPYCIAAIGKRAAQYYFLSALPFDAKQACYLGLVHRIINSQENIYKEGLKLAKNLLANSPQSMAAVKCLLNDASLMPSKIFFSKTTVKWLNNQKKTPDAQEGFQAFLEKRKPRWAKL